MAQVKIAVDVYLIEYQCDGCQKAGMRFTGQGIKSDIVGVPPRFIHVCPACKKTAMLDKQYPTTLMEQKQENKIVTLND